MAVLAAKIRHPRMRWIAHFSDPWAANPYLVYQSEEARRDAAKNERKVIESADAVVFVTEMTAELTMRRYPSDWRRKVVVIPHATDCELEGIEPIESRKSPVFRLTHTGALYGGRRSGDGLYTALRELNSDPNFQQSFELRLVGEMPPSLDATIESLGVNQVVSVATPLYFIPSLTEMDRANALLVIDADFGPSPFLPSKIFDYLLFDRPILALTPPGSATERFLSQLGYETAAPNDIPAIKRLLATLVDKWRRRELRSSAAHKAARQTFDLRNVAKQYENLFRRV